MSVSVLIPARNEIYLEKTLRNIQENAEGEIEVLVALDGWLPEDQIEMKDDRFIFHHYPESIGQRKAINELAKVAKGQYIMKLDAHCAVDKGFDIKLAEDCEYEWTVVPRMYNLDINTWLPKTHKRTDYMYIGWNEKNELRSLYYTGNQYKRWHRREELIDDTMGLMGPGFFMHKDRFWELGGCDENHGGWGQQGIEVACKAWLSGGALKVNKKTWFAHWFRGGGGPGFPYHITGRDVGRARKYSMDLWLNDKWPLQKRPFQWLIDKFNPPTWEKTEKKMEVSMEYDLTTINRNIRKIFKVLTRFDFSPIGCRESNRYNLIELWKLNGYKEGMEIGVHRGHFSGAILDGIPDVKMHCVDPWDTYPESKFSRPGQERNYQLARKRLDKYGDRATIYKDYSENVVSQFKDRSLDFIFIDGAHWFDACVMDLVKWCPKVKKGGMVAVHDYLPMVRGGVIHAVDAYTYCHKISPWFVTREEIPTAFWVAD